MNFSLGDLYPGYTNMATEHITQPDANDQQALAESPEAAVEAKATQARPKMVMLALIVVVLLVVFFGVN